MAYSFDRIMNVMGRNKDEPEQSNIFAPPGASGQAGVGNDRVMSASAEGSMAPAGAAAPQQNTPKPVETTPGSRSRLFEKNAGKAQSPVDLKGMQGQIASVGKSLQKEADNYVANADNQYEGGVKDSQKEAIKAWSGLTTLPNGRDPKDGQPLGEEPLPELPGGVSSQPYYLSPSLGWYDAYTQGPGQMKGYVPGVNTTIANADLLGTDAGIQKLFRQQGSPEYNAGDAAFDAALLRKNSKFNELRDQTVAQNDALQKQRRDIVDPTQKAAQKKLESAYGDWKDDVTKELEGALGTYEARGNEREGLFDIMLNDALKADQKKAETLSQQALEEFKAENPGLAFFLGSQFKPDVPSYGDYYTPASISADQTDWRDFINSQEAANWNKVMGLLGRDGDVMVDGRYAGKNASDYTKGNFDSSGFNQALLEAATKSQERNPIVVADSGKNIEVDMRKPPARAAGKGPGTGSPPYTTELPTDVVTNPYLPWVPEEVDKYIPETVPVSVPTGTDVGTGSEPIVDPEEWRKKATGAFSGGGPKW